MDVTNLQAFVAVAELGSFSQASERLYLSQPAISKRIASLETELNARLFDRIGRRINLTETGTALLPRARHILLEIEDSRRAISNLAGQIAGALHIGTSHHIGLHRMPPILRTFTATFPKVELDLHFMDSEQACKAVKHGDFELGIVTLPLEKDPGLNTRVIWPDPLAIVSNRAHSLAEQPDLSLTDLAQHVAILPSHGTYTREIIEQAMHACGVEIQVRMATNYLETIKMMVSVGLGWSILPCSMISQELKVLELGGIVLQRNLGVVWHAGRTLSNAASAMLSCLSESRPSTAA